MTAKMVRKHFFLTPDQIYFLENESGLNASEHVRRAIDEYRDRLKKTHVSISKSSEYGSSTKRD